MSSKGVDGLSWHGALCVSLCCWWWCVLVCLLWCDQDGATPLMAASQNGHLSVVERLVGCGANTKARDKVCDWFVIAGVLCRVLLLCACAQICWSVEWSCEACDRCVMAWLCDV